MSSFLGVFLIFPFLVGFLLCVSHGWRGWLGSGWVKGVLWRAFSMRRRLLRTFFTLLDLELD